MLYTVETGKCPVSTIFLPAEIPQITCIYILKWLIECNEILCDLVFQHFAKKLRALCVKPFGNLTNNLKVSFTGKILFFTDYFYFFTTMSCILLNFIYIFV
jgi:hypothetical protein